MKITLVLILVLLWTVVGFSQDTTKREPRNTTAYNIGKSPDPELYSADSIPLFIVKGRGRTYKISPAKIFELKPEGNNIIYVIADFIENATLFGGKSMPDKYKKYNAVQVMEVNLLEDKANDAIWVLKDKGYIK